MKKFASKLKWFVWFMALLSVAPTVFAAINAPIALRSEYSQVQSLTLTACVSQRLVACSDSSINR